MVVVAHQRLYITIVNLPITFVITFPLSNLALLCLFPVEEQVLQVLDLKVVMV